ncbi:hypothetical protein [Miniphocaeibacter massiliensis]|uniref:hypothetical protein n=1 Tax=Miniphocaeibacter massiliensis TaxID=2041841 RepID=UPI000C07668B|nr:hypothetical protein [Miniphocaeibacter massiliensis]
MENNSSIIKFNNENLINTGNDIVANITDELSIPRDLLPSKNDIDIALSLLPRELNKVPIRLRDKFIARLCVAVSVGLFDSAIVYIWNSAMNELKSRVKNFGEEMRANFLEGKIDDDFLIKITDSELLKISYQLNIISEQGFFFLNQAREIRNQASAAHPTEIEIDDRELITFISRCCKYALSNENIEEGIDIKVLNKTLENQDTTDENLNNLASNIRNTFKLQKELIMKILYSNFTKEENLPTKRNNSLNLAIKLKDIVDSKIQTDLIEKYNTSRIIGTDTSHSLAKKFFERMGLLSILGEEEQISILKKAITQLENAHYGMNNFYNEPIFAERLIEISKDLNPIPKLIIPEYIDVVFMCYLGNSYGISHSAYPYYLEMLKNLTPYGIEKILTKIYKNTIDMHNILIVPWKVKLLVDLLEYYDTLPSLSSKQKYMLSEIFHKYKIGKVNDKNE